MVGKQLVAVTVVLVIALSALENGHIVRNTKIDLLPSDEVLLDAISSDVEGTMEIDTDDRPQKSIRTLHYTPKEPNNGTTTTSNPPPSTGTADGTAQDAKVSDTPKEEGNSKTLPTAATTTIIPKSSNSQPTVSIVVVASEQRSSSTYMSKDVLAGMSCHVSLDEIFWRDKTQSGDAWKKEGKQLKLVTWGVGSGKRNDPSMLATFVLKVSQRRCREKLTKSNTKEFCNNHCWVNYKHFDVHLNHQQHQPVWEGLYYQNIQNFLPTHPKSALTFVVLERDVNDRWKSHWFAKKTGDWERRGGADHKAKLEATDIPNAPKKFKGRHERWYRKVRAYGASKPNIQVIEISFEMLTDRPMNVTQQEIQQVLDENYASAGKNIIAASDENSESEIRPNTDSPATESNQAAGRTHIGEGTPPLPHDNNNSSPDTFQLTEDAEVEAEVARKTAQKQEFLDQESEQTKGAVEEVEIAPERVLESPNAAAEEEREDSNVDTTTEGVESPNAIDDAAQEGNEGPVVDNTTTEEDENHLSEDADELSDTRQNSMPSEDAEEDENYEEGEVSDTPPDTVTTTTTITTNELSTTTNTAPPAVAISRTTPTVSIVVVASEQRSSSTYMSKDVLGEMPCHVSLDEIFWRDKTQSGDAWWVEGKQLGLVMKGVGSGKHNDPNMLARFILKVSARRCKEKLSKTNTTNLCNNHCWVNYKHFDGHLATHQHRSVWKGLYDQNIRNFVQHPKSPLTFVVLERNVTDRWKSHWFAQKTGDWERRGGADHKAKLEAANIPKVPSNFKGRHVRWYKRIRAHGEANPNIPVVEITFPMLTKRPMNVTQQEIQQVLTENYS